jgi:predicted dehydrogenase
MINLKYLIVGLGSIGCRHINNLYKLGVINLSAYRSTDKVIPFKIPKNVKIFRSFDLALKDNPDVVIICNPTSKHVEFALKALKKKCNLYIEKPLSNNLKNLNKLLKLSYFIKKKIIIGCQFRYHPGLNLINHWIKKNKIGKIKSVVCDVGEYLPLWHPWENYKKSYAARKELGGGVILTLIHEVDYLYWLFGKISSVYAIGSKNGKLKINVEDSVLISMITKSKIPIHLRMDYWRNRPKRSLNIVGEKGEINWNYHEKTTTLVSGGKILHKQKLSKKWNKNEMFISIMKNFINSIGTKKNPKVSLKESLIVLNIALAAKNSLKKNKLVFIK